MSVRHESSPDSHRQVRGIPHLPHAPRLQPLTPDAERSGRLAWLEAPGPGEDPLRQRAKLGLKGVSSGKSLLRASPCSRAPFSGHTSPQQSSELSSIALTGRHPVKDRLWFFYPATKGKPGGKLPAGKGASRSPCF